MEEIIDYVSMTTLDAASLRLATAVNTHIGQCETCLKTVQAFQTVYDAMLQTPAQKDNQKDPASLKDALRQRALRTAAVYREEGESGRVRLSHGELDKNEEEQT